MTNKTTDFEVKCLKCGHILIKGTGGASMMFGGLTKMGCRKCGNEVDLTKPQSGIEEKNEVD